MIAINPTDCKFQSNIWNTYFIIYPNPAEVCTIKFSCNTPSNTELFVELIIYNQINNKNTTYTTDSQTIKIIKGVSDYECTFSIPDYKIQNSLVKLIFRSPSELGINEINLVPLMILNNNTINTQYNKILYVLENSIIGGAELFTRDLIKNISSSVTIDTMDIIIVSSEGVLTTELKSLCDNYYFINNNQSELLEIIQSNDYTHVHFINCVHLFPSIQKIKKSSKVLITLLLDLHYYHKNMPRRFVLIENGIHDADAVFTDSYRNQKLFPDLTVIPIGISDAAMPDPERDRSGVLWVGALIDNKNPALVLDIASGLPDHTFTMVPSELSADNRNWIPDSGIPKNVKLINTLANSELLQQMARNTILLVTSKTESMPKVIIEGMTNEMCVVTTAVGDVSSVIDDGVTGYIIDSNNPVDFRDCIKNIDISIGQDAKSKIIESKYTLTSMIKSYSKYYNRPISIQINTPPMISDITKEMHKFNLEIYKVAFFCDVFGLLNYGGPAVHGYNVLECLIEQGVDVHLFCQQPDPDYILHPEITHTDALHNIHKYHDIIKECNVHYVLNGTSYVSRLNEMGINPIIGSNLVPNSAPQHCLSAVGLDSRSNDKTSEDERIWVSSVKSNIWIAQSRFQEREYRRLGLPLDVEVAIIQNPINIELFKRVNRKSNNKILWSGKNSWTKDVDTMVHIVRQLPEYNFICLSEDEKFTIPNKPHNIELIIGRKMIDIPKILQECCIFLSTSTTENNPLAVLEAMSCELPCVSMRTSGMPEIVHDYYNGVLVDRGNIEHILIELKRLMDYPDLTKLMGKNARKWVETNNSYESIITKYLTVFDKYIGK